MKAFRTNGVLRGTFILMTLMAWVVLSNHCALAALWTGAGKLAKIAVVKSSCPGCESKPAKAPGEKAPSPAECCKTLHAKVPEAAKLAGPPVQLCLLWIVDWVGFAGDQAAPTFVAKWTGPPPRMATFCELVLQGSLPSHAPPVGV